MAQPAEQPHNTREQLAEYARTACEVADELELAPADRAALLPVLIQLAAQKAIYQAPPPHLLAGSLPPIGRGH